MTIGRVTAERVERMKKKTDIAIANRPAPTECWVRKGDAIVDDVNGYSSTDFINALKSQSAAAWIALRAIVFNPVMNEKRIRELIDEKKYEVNELFGEFVEWMMKAGGIDKNKDPDKFVAYFQQCIRGRVNQCIGPRVRKRGGRIRFLDDMFRYLPPDGDVEPVDLIRREEILSAARNEPLQDDEKAIIHRCFQQLWMKHPRYAYVVALYNMGLSNHEIQEIVGERTDNNVAKIAQRGLEGLGALIRARKVAMPGVPAAGAPAKKGRRRHVRG